MNLVLVLKIASAVIAAAWLPLVVRFALRWRERRHPVSLAIVSTMLFICFVDVSAFWLWDKNVGPERVQLGVYAVEVIVCAHYYVAFYFARRWPSDKETP